IMAQQKNWKVLILEKHWVCGGFTHSFSRPGGYEWDVGLHYVGDMAPGAMPRLIFDYISGSKVKWQKMTDDFEIFAYPDFSFKVPSNREEYEQRLITLFPDEEKAIKRYFKDIKKAMSWFSKHLMAKSSPKAISTVVDLFNQTSDHLALSTTEEYLNKYFKDEKLKALLSSQWGDYGLSPEQSAFVIHAVVTSSYFEGAYYPLGGAASIAESIVSSVKEYGGDCRVASEVEEIVLEHNRAIGVKLKSGQIIKANYIISNTGAYSSYNKLVPKTEKIEFLNDLNQLAQTGYSTVSLYLGLKEDPSKLGFKGENHWLFSSYDHKAPEQTDDTLAAKVDGLYLSFPSLKNPKATAHTAEIIMPANYKAFEKWKDKKWKKRGNDYEALKEEISQALLAFVEERYPGFKDLVDYYELSTPLSNESFTSHYKGTIYGLAATPERFKKKYLSATTPIKGFYLTGTDVACLGIVGAMMGAVVTAAKIMGGAGFINIVSAAKKYSTEEAGR
ncbi:MAG TPA: NAD(P)/FAD-dependent oxidoreductase, partial [Trueperaceae bacterium]|nr:NAD(P)/FAD-dependent oxidoreductase [Trueperaceae bacterium]